NILRVPITFPPEPFRGTLLSAMCVPDLRGSQGTFTFYTTRATSDDDPISGETVTVRRNGTTVSSNLIGPQVQRRGQAATLRCPFRLTLNGERNATLRVGGRSYALARGRYTPWIQVSFKGGPGVKVRGICQFLLLRTEPELELYVTPIQIDPDRPAMPISHPGVYATYLSKAHGLYATLGLAEDTWALNAKLIDDDAFLHQVIQADEERERMFFDALDKVRRGLCVCVFDGTDRIQHMFWRYLDDVHPAHHGQARVQRRDAIEALYERMDALVGKTMERCANDTVLMVISDHGFNTFRRGVDWNRWLEENGYLTLHADGRGKKYLAGVDWSRTRAYALGLAGIWLNVKGRESQGIVEPAEADALRTELCKKLTGLPDAEKNRVAVSRAFNAHETYIGPNRTEAPDIIVGYARGYRASWETAVGQPTDKVFHDNAKAWSGDHCIDPKLVPGVLFCNRRIKSDRPRLVDIAATVLELFGVAVPSIMDGRPIGVADGDGRWP
ncbi:MAG: alkaline phosphatase family protein, partial [Phycisphaerae bacterium]